METGNVQGWEPGSSSEPPKPLEVGDTITTSFRVVGQNFPAFFGISLLIVIPLTIVTFIVAIAMHFMMQSALGGDQSALIANAVLALVGYLAMILVVSVTYALGQGAIMYATIESLVGRKASIGDALGAAMRRFLPLWGASLLFGLIVTIGTMLCFVPGVIAWVWLAVTLPVCMVERVGPIASLQRSLELTEGHRVTIFLAFLVLMVGFMGIGMCVIAPAMIGTTLAAGDPTGIPDPLSLPQIVIRLLSSVMQIFSTMLLSSMTAVIYARIRGLRDGVDARALAQIFA